MSNQIGVILGLSGVVMCTDCFSKLFDSGPWDDERIQEVNEHYKPHALYDVNVGPLYSQDCHTCQKWMYQGTVMRVSQPVGLPLLAFDLPPMPTIWEHHTRRIDDGSMSYEFADSILINILLDDDDDSADAYRERPQVEGWSQSYAQHLDDQIAYSLDPYEFVILDGTSAMELFNAGQDNDTENKPTYKACIEIVFQLDEEGQAPEDFVTALFSEYLVREQKSLLDWQYSYNGSTPERLKDMSPDDYKEGYAFTRYARRR